MENWEAIAWKSNTCAQGYQVLYKYNFSGAGHFSFKPSREKKKEKDSFRKRENRKGKRSQEWHQQMSTVNSGINSQIVSSRSEVAILDKLGCGI